MTQTGKLKKAIRARSRKTGETYAAARRQYLKPPPPVAPPKTAEAGGMTEASARRVTASERSSLAATNVVVRKPSVSGDQERPGVMRRDIP